MDLGALKEWFLGLGQQYHVNPIIFGAIYVGAIPFFSASVAWLVRNYRRRKSIVLPTLSAGFCFVSAYLYLIVAGRNVPLWVYGAVVALLIFGAVSAVRKVRKQINEREYDFRYRLEVRELLSHSDNDPAHIRVLLSRSL